MITLFDSFRASTPNASARYITMANGFMDQLVTDLEDAGFELEYDPYANCAKVWSDDFDEVLRMAEVHDGHEYEDAISDDCVIVSPYPF